MAEAAAVADAAPAMIAAALPPTDGRPHQHSDEVATKRSYVRRLLKNIKKNIKNCYTVCPKMLRLSSFDIPTQQQQSEAMFDVYLKT